VQKASINSKKNPTFVGQTSSIAALIMPLAAGAAKPCISENHHYPPTVDHGEQPVEPSDAGQGRIPSRKGTKNGKRNFRCQLPAILIPPDTWERNACGRFSF
jgi:hypothetical protein